MLESNHEASDRRIGSGRTQIGLRFLCNGRRAGEMWISAPLQPLDRWDSRHSLPASWLTLTTRGRFLTKMSDGEEQSLIA